MLLIVNLLIKTDFAVSSVPCMLERACCEPISFKNCRFGDILYWLVEFCVLSEIHVSKTLFKQINENLRLNVYARMF